MTPKWPVGDNRRKDRLFFGLCELNDYVNIKSFCTLTLILTNPDINWSSTGYCISRGHVIIINFVLLDPWVVYPPPKLRQISLHPLVVTLVSVLSATVSPVTLIWILWFGNVLYRQFGPRITLWLGGVFCSFGLALIAFWQSLLSFYIGIGFFVGLGFSFVILIGSVTISRYFKAWFQGHIFAWAASETA